MRKEFITPSINVKSFSREILLTNSTVTPSNEDLATAELTAQGIVDIQKIDITW